MHTNRSNLYADDQKDQVSVCTDRPVPDKLTPDSSLTVWKTVSHILSSAETPEQGIPETLSYLGRTLDVSRIYIFENDPEDPAYADNTFEWCAEGIEPQIGNLQHMRLADFGYDQLFQNNRMFYCPDVSALEENMRTLFEPQGIKAILNYAFYNNGRFAGFIGIDDCTGKRMHWEDQSREIDILSFAADLLTTHLIKERNLARARHLEAMEKERRIREEETNTRLKQYLSAVSCGILQYTRDTKQILHANQDALHLLGYSSVEEMQADSFNGVVGTVHPDDAAMMNRLIDGLQFGDRAEYEYRVMLKDGIERICYGAAMLIFREEEEPLVQRTIIDITASHNNYQKETESLLEAFRIASGATGDVLFIYDIKESTSLLSFSGTQCNDTDMIISDVPYGAARQGYIADSSINEFVRVHEEIMNGAVSAKATVEIRQLFGRHGVFELTLQAFLDKDGNPTGKAVGVYHDISSMARHTREQSMIIDTLSSAYCSIYHIDLRQFTYLRIREEDELALVFPNAGDWACNFRQYTDHSVLAEFRSLFDRLLDRDYLSEKIAESGQIVVEYRSIDSKWRRGFLYPVSYDENNTLQSVVFAVQYIEEEKQRELDTQQALREAYEAAQLASVAKTTFLSNMSHDIRTPMNAIIGMTAIAGAHLNEPDRIADCLKKISSSGRHLLGLINQVLDMSKIESGKIDLAEEEFILSDAIDEVIAMNHTAGRMKNHDLRVHIGNLIHEHVIGDRTRLEQVFNNLLSNAIKYTPEGGTISLSIREKETPKTNIGWYEVVIQDNGIGMTEDFRKTIFEPFARAADLRAASKQGTGLGMPIARNIVRMMNGDIKVDSTINEGSTFTVTFALKINQSQNAHIEYFVDLPVLVVDDDEPFCKNTCEILNSLAMKSEYVTSGPEAVRKTEEHHEKQDDYYAIIMDWKMPGMDGVETTRQIRQRVGRDVPIIVLTSYDWSEIEEEAIEAGVNAFLSKPLFRSKVIELFHELHVGKPHTGPEEAEIINHTDFRGKRILLAEDNELNREIALELLGMTGVEIETAEDGSICVDLFTSREAGYYDLIFMDIQMPKMNGHDAAKAIRASDHPDAKKIPIIAMTANAFSSDVIEARESGMNGHIPKPIDMDIVLKSMAEYLL